MQNKSRIYGVDHTEGIGVELPEDPKPKEGRIFSNNIDPRTFIDWSPNLRLVNTDYFTATHTLVATASTDWSTS